MLRIMLIAGLVLLRGLAAHAQTTSTLNITQFGAICDGQSHPLAQKFATLSLAQASFPFITSLSQQIDYAALKLASNTAFGGDGAEHGTSNPQANIPLYIPAGVCYLGNDTWTIRAADGISIQGASAMASKIEANGVVLAFDGLWYSNIGNLNIATLSSSAPAALDIDGNVPGHPYGTFTVQANTFTNLFVDGDGSPYGISLCRQGGSGAQCSENTFINPHLTRASEAVFFQNGFNAVDNVILGGDIQNYPKNAIELIAGSVKVLGMSFESTTGYTQIANGGCDIQASAAGVYDLILAYGDRTESLCFYNGAWSQWADIRGLTHRPGFWGWTASANYPLSAMIEEKDQAGTYHLYLATTPGAAGASQPTWPATGSVTDGTVVWTVKPYQAVGIAEGSFDAKTSYIDPAATVVEGSPVSVSSCGNSPSLAASSTRYSGSVAEGSGATGCTIALKFGMSSPAPRCVVGSQNGAALAGYSVTDSALILTNPASRAGGGKYTWICEQ